MSEKREWYLQNDKLEVGKGPYADAPSAWVALVGHEASPQEIKAQRDAGWYLGWIRVWYDE